MDNPVGVPSSHTREHTARREHERTESSSTSPQRSRRPGGSTQKATLSKALQKANTAVLLDNAANFEGAIEAYQDACELLQPMSGDSIERREDSQPVEAGFEDDGARSTSAGEEEEEEEEEEEIDDNQSHVPDYDTTPLQSSSHEALLGLALDNSNRDTDRFTPMQEDSELAKDFIPRLSPRHNFSSDADISQHNTEAQVSKTLGLHTSEGEAPTNDQSTSWLDTIDESGASSPASTQTKLSLYIGSTHSHNASNGTEADFDAALDAAVEAAYDEGLEPALNQKEGFYDDNDDDDDYDHDDVVSNARRNIEIAKQRVREAEREAQAVMARQMHGQAVMAHNDNLDSDYIDEEAEEEERILEEMTKGYVMDDLEFNLHTKTALPRQSDSSTISGRTWGSSVTSNSATAGTPLSTLTEEGDFTPSDAAVPNKRLPPIPKIPTGGGGASGPVQQNTSIMSPSGGVRARRFSRSNAKQLKIDTKRIPTGFETSKKEPFSAQPAQPPSPVLLDEPKTSLPILTSTAHSGTSERNAAFDNPRGEHYDTGLTKVRTQDSDAVERSAPPSPPRHIHKIISGPGMLRKNTSSSSLGGLRGRGISISTPDTSTDSPNTPSGSYFPPFDLQRNLVSTGTSYPRSLHLFDNEIHSPTTPGSPNLAATNAPIPLEPCPESFLLRPFWLMRCLYQTLAHPRGGYLSTKLFIPREIWQVKNVRIRAMDDKISLCDLLTAALLKVAQVDKYDADAVLEEMQTFENILDQAQATFARKLGNEVGVHGALPLFKNINSPDESPVLSEGSLSRNSSHPGRSYLTSWRKLRSKSSTTTNSSNFISSSTPRDSGKGGLSMNTLPMTTSYPSERFAKRDVMQLQFNGPNANYMGALARLFDAVQVLDQIARQVEDPGLKHSSPTHVGLELSTRHAAEFFGFYICRFALNDVGLLLDNQQNTTRRRIQRLALTSHFVLITPSTARNIDHFCLRQSPCERNIQTKPMPRPPARRTRTVRQPPADVPSRPVNKNNGDAQSNTEAKKRVTTPRRAGNNDEQGDLTPTGNSNENAIASSPAENTTTTSIRPPTRARGYSATLSLVGRKGEFNSRIGSTPGFESSILSNFKRRTRQPSLLQMMQADDDSSDFDDDDFLGGLSSPQDESTPLNATSRAPIVDSQLAVSPSRPPVVASPSSRESRKRKRQSQEARNDQDSANSRSSSLSTLTRVPETPSVRESVDPPSTTMATPLSTDTTSPTRLGLDSQVKQSTTSEGAADPLPKVTTLNIQAKFLPQRRIRHLQRADDSDDAESANEDTDEDELSRAVMRRPQRPRKKGLSNATSDNTNTKKGSNSHGGRKNKGNAKGSHGDDDLQSKSQRTYSRQKPQASDKENLFSDDSSALSSPPPSEDLATPPHSSTKRISSRELQQQALKFAEVDKWEMEFEEVSFSENSPSR
ncbi:hypothetical protein UA08_04387 [Talaromyces atroroseus]|uniref:MIT domain-containing protein n=1 Tax=Talaromyces atroroseus TaxID=1441469 RepID=A0A1Q5Q9F9_TALAT|nr:hypothetical protein UA08_04387 [Talaromyces atroroseus]OKL60754.1 hypothetical protein UA08_04387 [Talaromyces atroroseus]